MFQLSGILSFNFRIFLFKQNHTFLIDNGNQTSISTSLTSDTLYLSVYITSCNFPELTVDIQQNASSGKTIFQKEFPEVLGIREILF